MITEKMTPCIFSQDALPMSIENQDLPNEEDTRSPNDKKF